MVDKVATSPGAQEAALELHPWTSHASPHEPTLADRRGSGRAHDLGRGADPHTACITRWSTWASSACPRPPARAVGLGAGAPRYLRRDARLGRAAVADDRAAGARHRQLGVGQARSEGPGRLDFTQNAVNKTLVAAYSMRPAGGAGVRSDPLGGARRPGHPLRPLDDRTIGARVKKVGDLFAPANELAQELPPWRSVQRAAMAAAEGRHRGASPRVERVSGPRRASRRQCWRCAFGISLGTA